MIGQFSKLWSSCIKRSDAPAVFGKSSSPVCLPTKKINQQQVLRVEKCGIPQYRIPRVNIEKDVNKPMISFWGWHIDPQFFMLQWFCPSFLAESSCFCWGHSLLGEPPIAYGCWLNRGKLDPRISQLKSQVCLLVEVTLPQVGLKTVGKPGLKPKPGFWMIFGWKKRRYFTGTMQYDDIWCKMIIVIPK